MKRKTKIQIPTTLTFLAKDVVTVLKRTETVSQRTREVASKRV